ncbi:hypothetical protein IJ384_06530 [bacterium]|nr:hypothetical protein [bacterium]
MGKKSSKTTSKTVYGNTTTTNPYVTSQTTNNGTTSVFNPDSALGKINEYVNNNMDSLLEEYLNPTLNSVTNQAKMNSFTDTLNSETTKNMENNIVNPLSRRNMIRSSQATNLYNNLVQNNANQIANYANELLGNSQSEMAKTLSNLMLLYMNGYNAVLANQQQSLATSQGNAKKTQNTTESANYVAMMSQLAAQIAMAALK